MKPLFYLAAAICFAFTSPAERRLTEKPFRLSSVVAMKEVDLDGDGILNSNLRKETTCYDGGKITFHADGTFHFKITGMLGIGDYSPSSCSDYRVFGHWTMRSDVIVMTYENEDEDDVTITATWNEKQLVIEQKEALLKTTDDIGDQHLEKIHVKYIFKK